MERNEMRKGTIKDALPSVLAARGNLLSTAFEVGNLKTKFPSTSLREHKNTFNNTKGIP